MKKIFLIISWLSLAQNVNAQEAISRKASSDQEIKFLKWFFTESANNRFEASQPAKIYYKDSVSINELTQIKERLKGVLYDYQCPLKNGTLRLADLEIDSIQIQLNQMENKQLWSDSLFDNARVYQKKQTKLTDKHKSAFNNSNSDFYYVFTKPIFIRNNTICIFYCAYSSSHFRLMVFRKTDGKWQDWFTLFNVIS